MDCFFKDLPGAGPCDGELRVCHLITRQTLRHEFPFGVWRPVGERRWHKIERLMDDPRGVSSQTIEWMSAKMLAEGYGDLVPWVPGCGGPMGNAGHNGRMKPDGPVAVAREALPAALEGFAEELGIGWVLDRTYGERSMAA